MTVARNHPRLTADLRRVPKAFITRHSGLTGQTIKAWLDGTTKTPAPASILAAKKAVARWEKEYGHG